MRTSTAATTWTRVVTDGEHVVYCPGLDLQASLMTVSHALVTGGAGFIGTHLVTALRARGSAVTVLDNLSVGRREQVPADVRFVHGDVRDDAAVRDALQGVDAVFHLAAQVTIRGSFDRFYDDLDTNVMGTACLVRAVDPDRVRWFTLASSMAVYADAPMPRRSPRRIRRVRSRPMVSASWPQRAWRGRCSAGEACPSRPSATSTPSGPGRPTRRMSASSPSSSRHCWRGEPLTIFGDGEQQRDFVHVRDIAAGTVATVGRSPGTYNLGTGRGLTLNRLGGTARAHDGRDSGNGARPGAGGELRYSVADISAARETLGYTPTRSLETDLAEVVADVASR